MSKFILSGAKSSLLTLHNATAITEPLKDDYTVQSFEFLIQALSEAGLIRMGVIDVSDCDETYFLSSHR